MTGDIRDCHYQGWCFISSFWPFPSVRKKLQQLPRWLRLEGGRNPTGWFNQLEHCSKTTASTREPGKLAFSHLTVCHSASGMQPPGSGLEPSNLFLLILTLKQSSHSSLPHSSSQVSWSFLTALLPLICPFCDSFPIGWPWWPYKVRYTLHHAMFLL